jgi:arsenate reductase
VLRAGGVTMLRILFLCTGNSARSQIAEALLASKGAGRFEVASAGSKPAPRVNPYAVEVLREVGLDWSDRQPKGIDAVADRPWDFVITVCDRAKESCPVLPGTPVMAHWGMDDPAEVSGSDAEVRRAFLLTRQMLARRIDLLLALPLEKLDRLTTKARLDAIASETRT